MPDPVLSVVVVTYNRLPILQRTLTGLERQTLPRDQFEILVVNDGSTDRTESFLREYSQRTPLNFRLRIFQQATMGPAKSRNMAIKEARGWIVLFLGDDVIPAQDLLQEHVNWHRKESDDKLAILGLTTWDPTRPITPFMRWLEKSGPQYKFWAIQDSDNVGYRHFYTTNVSVKRKFIQENGLFDEEFPPSTHEDMEAAYRMEQAGMRLVYNSQAIGHHDHYTTVDSAIRRMHRLGLAQRMYLRKTEQRPPRTFFNWGPSRLVNGVKFTVFHLLGKIMQRYRTLPGVYSYLLEEAMAEGMKSRKALR